MLKVMKFSEKERVVRARIRQQWTTCRTMRRLWHSLQSHAAGVPGRVDPIANKGIASVQGFAGDGREDISDKIATRCCDIGALRVPCRTGNAIASRRATTRAPVLPVAPMTRIGLCCIVLLLGWLVAKGYAARMNVVLTGSATVLIISANAAISGWRAPCDRWPGCVLPTV